MKYVIIESDEITNILDMSDPANLLFVPNWYKNSQLYINDEFGYAIQKLLDENKQLKKEIAKLSEIIINRDLQTLGLSELPNEEKPINSEYFEHLQKWVEIGTQEYYDACDYEDKFYMDSLAP